MTISIIVAMADNRVIGVENRLPWKLPEDMKWFRRHTLGKPVVMGRLTFESIGRPLPERTNIVISGNRGWGAEGCTVVHDVETALRVAGSVPEVMVIGGASLYTQVLPLADRLYLTLVHADIKGDAWFPPIDFAEWRELERSDGEGGGFRYSFVIMERLAQAGS